MSQILYSLIALCAFGSLPYTSEEFSSVTAHIELQDDFQFSQTHVSSDISEIFQHFCPIVCNYSSEENRPQGRHDSVLTLTMTWPFHLCLTLL